MFPQSGPQGIGLQQGMVGNGYSTSPAYAQTNSLLGQQQFLPQAQSVDYNTTAPSSSTDVHPAVQNMIKALKGGM